MNLSNVKIKFSQKKVKLSYITACSYDVQCIKPGNVNYLSSHHDTSIDDFIKSYNITSDIISMPDMSLGARVYECVKSTKRTVDKNTNLGIVLLCSVFSQSLLFNTNSTLIESIKNVVMNSTVQDVSDICDAISLANPGGLNSHDTYDVRSKPNISLFEVMRISSDYDQISKQFSSFFSDIFSFIIPMFHQSLENIKDTKLAISYSFLKILEKYPDSHITRKYGHKIAKKTSKEASDLIKILDGDTRHESWGKNLMSLDKHFKMARVNPGTTADLLVISMMIYDYFIGIDNV